MAAREAEEKTKQVESRQFEARVWKAGADKQKLRFVRARVEELTVECDILTIGAERAKSERNTLAAGVQELEAAAVKRDSEPGVVLSILQSMKDRVAVDESRGDTAESWAHDALNKKAELNGLVEALTRTVAGERVPVDSIVDAEFSRVRSVITAALNGSEETLSDTIGVGCEGFPASSASSASRASVDSTSSQA